MFEFTESDQIKAINGYFFSESPLKLRQFPSKQKKKYIILSVIVKMFEKSKKYSEKEVNEILIEIYPDFVTLRRALIDYHFMSRTRDGKAYWLE
ncbi:DUF2087 domain-containing protein [Mycoplasmatota bacterium WC30]